MARTARNYRYVHRSNLKATRAARRSKARFYKEAYKLPKPMHFTQPRRRTGRFIFSRIVRNPGRSKPRGLKASFNYPVKKGPRIIKSKVMKRHVRKFVV